MEIFGPGACASPTPEPKSYRRARPQRRRYRRLRQHRRPRLTPTPPDYTDTDSSEGHRRRPVTPETSPTPGVTPPAQAVNFSTRMHVEGGDRVGIGGFIVTGARPSASSCGPLDLR